MLGYLLGYGPYVGLHGSGPLTHTYEKGQARAERRQLRTEIQQLREELATMALVNKVLVRTLVANNVCIAQQFEDLFHEIDLEDGSADGKVTEAARQMCPSCGRRLPLHRSVCMYCGTDAGRQITL